MTSKPGASKVKSGISRRTVVTGTAWAVPAIVVASAAPAFALSGPVTFTGLACKSPGNNSRYLFQISVTNTNNVPIVIHPVSLVVNGDTSETICPATDQTVPAHGQATFTFIAGRFSNSANGTAVFNYTYGPAGNLVPGQASSGFNDLPPIQGAQCQLDVPTGCTILG